MIQIFRRVNTTVSYAGEQLQYQQMPFLLLCKLLLCSLLFFIIASILTANSSVATIAGSHFVFNIVVYAFKCFRKINVYKSGGGQPEPWTEHSHMYSRSYEHTGYLCPDIDGSLQWNGLPRPLRC